MRKILITGANRGLGLEWVTQCLHRGDHVFAACRSPDQARQLRLLASIFPKTLSVLALDVTNPEALHNLLDKLSEQTENLDVLVNNAGILPRGERFGELQAMSLDLTMRTNVYAPLLLAQALAPLLYRGNSAVVMNVSSVLGSIALQKDFYNPSYCTSKAALNMVTRLLAAEFKPHGVAVLSVHPGWVKTDMGGENAEISVQSAVAGLLKVLDQTDLKSTGSFMSWKGEEIPW
jgi:NAD(P)-dependent dehydrogenase (short-subunit alcohol dehydrogenase family)